MKKLITICAVVIFVMAMSAGAATTTVTALPVTNTVGAADYAPGFAPESWQANATVAGQKSEYYVSPQALFGRDVTIGELSSISYFTKKNTTHTVDAADWYINIYTVPDTNLPVHGTWYGNRIGSEPYFSENLLDPCNTWNQWVTPAGQNNRLRFFDSTNNQYFGSYTDGFLSDLTGDPAYNNQKILLFSVQTGSAWANGFTGLVDGLSIELTSGDVGRVNFVATSYCPEPLVGDLDGDCRVDFIDFAMMAENWLNNNLVLQESNVTLGWTNSGMASWTTTTSMVGPSSVELYWPNTTSNGYADIDTPVMTLGQVNTWSCWVKGINSSGGQVMVADVSFYLGDAKNTVVHSSFLWGCNPPIDTWTQVTQASISPGSGIYSVRGIGVNDNLSSWASVISKYGSYNLSYVRLGMGNKGYTGSFTSYVDDFVMNGTTYVVEPATIICSEPLVGDLDGDCRVNLVDLEKMAENWLRCDLQPQSSCP